MKSSSFHHPAHDGNKCAYSRTAFCDWREVFASGEKSPREKLPVTWRDIDERVLRDGGAMLLPLLWRFSLERPPPLCVMESLPSRHYSSITVSWFIGSSTSLKSWNLSHQPNHSPKWHFKFNLVLEKSKMTCFSNTHAFTQFTTCI